MGDSFHEKVRCSNVLLCPQHREIAAIAIVTIQSLRRLASLDKHERKEYRPLFLLRNSTNPLSFLRQSFGTEAEPTTAVRQADIPLDP